MRPKLPKNERVKPLTVYLRPDKLEQLKKMADTDKRTLSAMATFLIDHAMGCHLFKIGHVPLDQIEFLHGQGKSERR